MTGALLECREVSVSFGGNRALIEVDLAVRSGEITGLIGPNGAGKTTLFNAITGMIEPQHGTLVLDGHDLCPLRPHERARLGLARTFQRLELFTDLSVGDNLRVAAEARASWQRRARVDVEREVGDALATIGLTELSDRKAATLPTGSARLVELGRALLLRPKLLLLDEPASGQSEDETTRFEALLRTLVAERGISILLVEHDMALVMGVCDRIHVLDFGSVISVGTPSEVRADPRVSEAYLGAAP